MSQQDELAAMRTEFYADATTRERQIEIATRMRDMAEAAMPESKCLFCKHTGFHIPHTEALIEGHCYSEDGVRDYTQITRVCEFCFDNLPSDEEEGEMS